MIELIYNGEQKTESEITQEVRREIRAVITNLRTIQHKSTLENAIEAINTIISSQNASSKDAPSKIAKTAKLAHDVDDNTYRTRTIQSDNEDVNNLLRKHETVQVTTPGNEASIIVQLKDFMLIQNKRDERTMTRSTRSVFNLNMLNSKKEQEHTNKRHQAVMGGS